MAGQRYFGDADSQQAWQSLKSEKGAALVDVRTAAEWSYVGLPDVTDTGAPLLRVECADREEYKSTYRAKTLHAPRIRGA